MTTSPPQVSPPGVEILAEVPNVLGPKLTGQMTYYETRAGARVFAAGAFEFIRLVHVAPVISRLVENLWARLASD